MKELEYLEAVKLSTSGRKLKQEQIKLREIELQANPENTNTRIELIGFYYDKQQWNQEARKSIFKHISWFISNSPGHVVLGMPETSTPFVSDKTLSKDLESIWEDVLTRESKDPKVLINAASFLRFRQPARAKELREQAELLQNQNS